MPTPRAESILVGATVQVPHTGFDPEAIGLAVRAHVRHCHTRYDELLARRVDPGEASASVLAAVDEVVERWRVTPS